MSNPALTFVNILGDTIDVYKDEHGRTLYRILGKEYTNLEHFCNRGGHVHNFCCSFKTERGATCSISVHQLPSNRIIFVLQSDQPDYNRPSVARNPLDLIEGLGQITLTNEHQSYHSS